MYYMEQYKSHGIDEAVYNIEEDGTLMGQSFSISEKTVMH